MESGGFSPREQANADIFRPERAGAKHAGVPSGRIPNTPVFLGFKTQALSCHGVAVEKPIPVSLEGGQT